MMRQLVGKVPSNVANTQFISGQLHSTLSFAYLLVGSLVCSFQNIPSGRRVVFLLLTPCGYSAPLPSFLTNHLAQFSSAKTLPPFLFSQTPRYPLPFHGIQVLCSLRKLPYFFLISSLKWKEYMKMLEEDLGWR